ncbi:MAG: VWA domain-containing protein [Bdellovibrionaceae bacterium]|nr:VWA domain-containing protein [Pseudobdellovibrionaceae bacterium]
MLRFEAPEYFLWLWIVPLVVVAAWFFSKKSQQRMQKIFGTRLGMFLTSSVSTTKRRWKVGLQCLALGFLIVALARPQSGSSKEKVRAQGVEIMIAADVSESMLSEDVKPNRLSQVKSELNRLIDMMPGNRIGVIAFAGSSVLLSPLTQDPGAVKMYIDSLDTNSVSTQGTSFRDLFEMAVSAFERGGVPSDEVHRVTRVLLILSDGEDHEGGALEKAQELAKSGIHIFTVAYGTEKGGTIPIRDQTGYLRGYKKDRKGNTILTTVRGEFLRKLAEAGGGSFYFSTFGGDHISNLVEDIQKLEQSQFEASMAVQYEERFQIFILITILLGLIELLLGERRSSSMPWRGRFEVS